ncbi:radical SAM protein [Aneurinibacillus sp. Ricciae_BoGa-3]|uniref:SPL family radical SAM protein n=1 Tax=Aneurinibacillus sp. Ricciae_BoGa-3 TaxID=3022697 RepID=UPI002341D939|nr:radical SAM protein [Aneurinibacillus sp. Ricciae_BoGa-3]WCK52642.1 radical SAM protein [Aneurinibacillus sp. Ricciae_BoGa-3]
MKTYEEIQTKNTMGRVTEPRMPFEWSINPYRGCYHGCSFCYARSTHSFLGMGADDSFQNHIFIKKNAAEALEEQLRRKLRKHAGSKKSMIKEIGRVVIGTATDPYQPIEAKALITRECLKVLSRYKIPTMITTRSPLILRDLVILQEMNLLTINISINTLDSNLSRAIEPAAPFPMKRLETVCELSDHGLPAGIFMAPILPKLTDSTEQLEGLIKEAKRQHAKFIIPSVLRLKPEVKEWYFQTLEEYAPHLLEAYRRQYKSAYPSAAYSNALLLRVHKLLDKHGMPYQLPAHINVSETDETGQEEQMSFSF